MICAAVFLCNRHAAFIWAKVPYSRRAKLQSKARLLQATANLKKRRWRRCAVPVQRTREKLSMHFTGQSVNEPKNLLSAIGRGIVIFIKHYQQAHNRMSNKKQHWLKLSFSAIKILITVLTVIVYFHYFRHQSWGYFTIDPKKPLINIYAVTEGILSHEPVIKNNMSYGMGISRKGIILYNELANIVSTNKNLVWKKLNEDSLSFIVTAAKDVSLINHDDLKIGKGRFLITKTERVPFQMIDAKKKFIPTAYYTLTDIR